MVYLQSVENVITLGKLIGLLFFILSPPPLYYSVDIYLLCMIKLRVRWCT